MESNTYHGLIFQFVSDVGFLYYAHGIQNYNGEGRPVGK